MWGTVGAIALTLAVVIVSIYEFNLQRKEQKKNKDYGKNIALLNLMDEMRDFLKIGMSVDDVYTMMPANLRTSEREIHDKCKSQYPDDPCYCLVCCLDREVTNEIMFTKQYEGRVH